MIVNKSDIINLVSKTNNLNISDIEYSIKKIIDYMGSNLYQGERIEIRGFRNLLVYILINHVLQEILRLGKKLLLSEEIQYILSPVKSSSLELTIFDLLILLKLH